MTRPVGGARTSNYSSFQTQRSAKPKEQPAPETKNAFEEGGLDAQADLGLMLTVGFAGNDKDARQAIRHDQKQTKSLLKQADAIREELKGMESQLAKAEVSLEKAQEELKNIKSGGFGDGFKSFFGGGSKKAKRNKNQDIQNKKAEVESTIADIKTQQAGLAKKKKDLTNRLAAIENKSKTRESLGKDQDKAMDTIDQQAAAGWRK